MLPITWVIPIAGLAAIAFALYLAWDVLRADTGTAAMQEIAGTIYEGAVAFIRRQYLTIGLLALGGAVVIGGVIAIVEGKQVADTDIYGLELGIRTGVAFLVGAACSMASGIIGMFISVRAEPADRRGRAQQPGARGAGCAAGRGRLRLPGGGALAARRLRHLRRIRRLHRPEPGTLPDRGLRVRRELRGPVRPARRWDLHEGRRCRRRPRRQGRGGDPGG